ncbi:MAG: hypothetical protein KAQ68_00935, partial [Clostridiales bacterium]|nr:hypothetical protein [Clostridiales bacterium]
MKNIKLSTKLYVSFALILVLLISVVTIELITINSIQTKTDKQNYATAINENAQHVRQWTLDYYDTLLPSSAEEIINSYTSTRSLVEESSLHFTSPNEKNIIHKISEDLNAYNESFVRYKQYVEQNEEHSLAMDDSINRIESKITTVMVDQQGKFKVFLDKVKLQSYGGTINISDLIEQVDTEYDEVFISTKASSLNKNAMISLLRYLWLKDDSSDADVYKNINELCTQCDLLYESLDNDIDRRYIDDAKILMADFTTTYESYKELLASQTSEKQTLTELISDITTAASTLASQQQSNISKNMSTSYTFAILFGIASIILGTFFALFITRNLVKQLTTNINSLSQSATLVASTSIQLSGASQQLSDGSTQQAASIQETSAIMDETSSMVKQNAENTKQANDLSKQATDAAKEGSYKMLSMSTSMAELKKSSGDISKIIKV